MKTLKPEIKSKIMQAFKAYCMHPDMPGDVVADLCAKHGAALLEIADEHPEWFEAASKPQNLRVGDFDITVSYVSSSETIATVRFENITTKAVIPSRFDVGKGIFYDNKELLPDLSDSELEVLRNIITTKGATNE